jgi:hypothetical protein
MDVPLVFPVTEALTGRDPIAAFSSAIRRLIRLELVYIPPKARTDCSIPFSKSARATCFRCHPTLDLPVQIICIPDSAEAAKRDEFFLSGSAPLPAPFPISSRMDCLIAAELQASGVAGQLSPHAVVRAPVGEGRFDQVVGLGFLSCLGAGRRCRDDFDFKSGVAQ